MSNDVASAPAAAAKLIPRNARAQSFSLASSRIVAWKEMLQMCNRRSFHIEMALPAIGMAAYLAMRLILEVESRRSFDPRALTAMGRSVFLSLSILACCVAGWVSLVSASGIVHSEIVGKRMPLLRITGLSLGTIVIGKGLSVMARAVAAVVLAVPLLAAAQLLGGVSQADVVFAGVVTAADVFLLTCMGLWASAGAGGGAGRLLRTVAALLLWLVATGSIPFLRLVLAVCAARHGGRRVRVPVGQLHGFG